MAESEGNLEESEDEEIQRILDARHAKNATKATKNALKTFSITNVFYYKRFLLHAVLIK